MNIHEFQAKNILNTFGAPIQRGYVASTPTEATEIAKEAVKINAKVLWLQLDIKNQEAKKIAEENNILYIENKCTKIEFEKYFN